MGVKFLLEQKYIFVFLTNDINAIKTGLKNTFKKEEILTGRAFCDILHIDYDSIIKSRLEDAEDNFNYFIEELIKIEQVKSKILSLLDK